METMQETVLKEIEGSFYEIGDELNTQSQLMLERYHGYASSVETVVHLLNKRRNLAKYLDAERPRQDGQSWEKLVDASIRSMKITEFV
jgi:hypothetical protein